MVDTPNIARALNQAANFVQATWQQVVMGALQVPGATSPRVNIGLRQIYADSIVTSDMLTGQGSMVQAVIATKRVARDLEDGKGPWDMKPMLLGGPKARMGKNGKYNIIPFRHGTSNKHAPNSNFKTMPAEIYKQARKLKASVQAGNRMAWGGTLPATSVPSSNKTTGYQHKHDIHEGMYRIEKQYAKATQNKYMTFRVVSDKSDPSSWWHPGYQAHHIAQGVSAHCTPLVRQMICEAAKQDVVNAIANIGFR